MRASPFEPFLKDQGIVILDGALATELATRGRGADLDDHVPQGLHDEYGAPLDLARETMRHALNENLPLRVRTKFASGESSFSQSEEIPIIL